MGFCKINYHTFIIFAGLFRGLFKMAKSLNLSFKNTQIKLLSNLNRFMRFKLNPGKLKHNNLFLIIVCSALLFSSCLSRKKTDYFQFNDNQTAIQDTVLMKSIFEPKIQTNDILKIEVASINPEAAKFFNPSDELTTNEDTDLSSYMVDLNGDIEIPLVGKMKVAGLTTRQIRDTLRLKLEKYLQSPTVRVNFNSYIVTVLGEVKLPGQYVAKTEKFTITDALGYAGDLTIYGDRQKVMVIRENDNKKEFNYIDLTQRDIFKSDLFYLHPGDVIYVPAGKGRIASADAFYRIAPLVLSTLTLIALIFYQNTN